jgi:catechol 2,3-dioxygenase-like lactoylglutathione lyase family enzyme
MELQGVDHVAFGFTEQDAAIAWFQDVLGLEPTHPEWERSPQMLARGGSGIAAFDAEGRSVGFLHLAFRVDRPSFEEAREHLAARGIQTRFQDHGTANSLYFEGPDGLRLELTTYDV